MGAIKPKPGRVRPRTRPTAAALEKAADTAWKFRRARSYTTLVFLGSVGILVLDRFIATLLERHPVLPYVPFLVVALLAAVASTWLMARERAITDENLPDVRWINPRRGSPWGL